MQSVSHTFFDSYSINLNNSRATGKTEGSSSRKRQSVPGLSSRKEGAELQEAAIMQFGMALIAHFVAPHYS